ncbi:MAG: hypothetical protein J6P21_02310 [Clostridia bacterium]|nr:hypothetical protein [Clostridia bacterium]
MKDVIKEILEANEKAKNDIENVEKLKLESAQRVKNKLSETSSEYIDKARMNIKVIQKIEESKAEVEIEKINEECEVKIKEIKNIYDKNKNLWINNIFDNIVGIL